MFLALCLSVRFGPSDSLQTKKEALHENLGTVHFPHERRFEASAGCRGRRQYRARAKSPGRYEFKVQRGVSFLDLP